MGVEPDVRTISRIIPISAGGGHRECGSVLVVPVQVMKIVARFVARTVTVSDATCVELPTGVVDTIPGGHRRPECLFNIDPLQPLRCTVVIVVPAVVASGNVIWILCKGMPFVSAAYVSVGVLIDAVGKSRN